MSARLAMRQAGDVAIIDISGRFILSEESGSVRAQVGMFLDAGHTRVLLNIAGVSFIDSSGIGEITGCHVFLKHKGGRLKVCSPVKRIRDVFSMIHLGKVLDIHDTEAEALHSFGEI